MALQMSVDDRFGSTHAECYIFLQAAIVDYEQQKTTVKVLFYVNKAAFDAGAQPFRTRNYEIALTQTLADSVLSDLQTKALASPAFSGAIEVP